MKTCFLKYFDFFKKNSFIKKSVELWRAKTLFNSKFKNDTKLKKNNTKFKNNTKMEKNNTKLKK